MEKRGGGRVECESPPLITKGEEPEYTDMVPEESAVTTSATDVGDLE